ncbi:hypothetical protein RQP46_001857 [Phenoliferia psychrophenolica]
MHLSTFLPFPALFALIAVTSAAPAAPATTFYVAPATNTPTATGNTAIPGSVISLTNSAYVSDTFIYTAALSTVAPTGNVTISPTGAAATANNLQPDPKNLQTVKQPSSTAAVTKAASAGRTVASGGVVVLFALIGGGAVFL